MPVKVLATPFNNCSPSLSPDGRWLAYTADESGRNEVYVRAYPGAGGRWQVSLEGGTEPLWSGRGGEIFYRNGDVMMSASVRTQPGFEVTGRTRLFTGEYQTGNFARPELQRQRRRQILRDAGAGGGHAAGDGGDAQLVRPVSGAQVTWLRLGHTPRRGHAFGFAPFVAQGDEREGLRVTEREGLRMTSRRGSG